MSLDNDGGDICCKSNANKNGLAFEKNTISINIENIKIIENNENYKKIKFNENCEEFIVVNKANLFKYMEKNNKLNKLIPKAHGCKHPDECYINEKSKIIFIIEKKFQKVGGSVCEKIQTSDFKVWHYQRTFPDYNIIYIYCLSKWFEENCKAELQYLKHKNVPVFFGHKKDYQKDIISFLLSTN